MEDDLLGDVKDIRMEKEKDKLTKFRVWYLVIVVIFTAAVAGSLWIYISGQDLSWFSGKIPTFFEDSQKKSAPEATPVWKTYTDTDLGYAFKYPSGWDINVLVTSDSGNYNRVSLIKVDSDIIINREEEELSEVAFWVSVYNKKYSNYVSQRDKDKSFSKQKSEEIVFASQKGKKYTFNFSANRQQNDIVISLGTDKTIALSYFTGSEETENIVSILKSFRFD